jgi:hypothetical protein
LAVSVLAGGGEQKHASQDPLDQESWRPRGVRSQVRRWRRNARRVPSITVGAASVRSPLDATAFAASGAKPARGHDRTPAPSVAAAVGRLWRTREVAQVLHAALRRMTRCSIVSNSAPARSSFTLHASGSTIGGARRVRVRSPRPPPEDSPSHHQRAACHRGRSTISQSYIVALTVQALGRARRAGARGRRSLCGRDPQQDRRAGLTVECIPCSQGGALPHGSGTRTHVLVATARRVVRARAVR